MGNTLRMVKQQQIQSLASIGWSNRAISEHIGVDRDTVSKYRNIFQNPPKVPADDHAENQEIIDGSDENPPKVPTGFSTPLPSTNSVQLRPFVAFVAKEYQKRLTAQRIYQDLVEQHDYRGGYDSVKRYVRKLRKRHRRYYERLSHLPGREAQVDFGKAPCVVRINGRYRHPWLFKMTLSCSKHAYEELVEHQDLETFIRCHERAFTFLGGVPEIVTLDNLKSGVLQASVYDPVLNATYLAFGPTGDSPPTRASPSPRSIRVLLNGISAIPSTTHLTARNSRALRSLMPHCVHGTNAGPEHEYTVPRNARSGSCSTILSVRYFTPLRKSPSSTFMSVNVKSMSMA